MRKAAGRKYFFKAGYQKHPEKMDTAFAKLEHNGTSIKHHFCGKNIFEVIKMVTLLKQARSNGDVTSTLLLRKNGRAFEPDHF